MRECAVILAALLGMLLLLGCAETPVEPTMRPIPPPPSTMPPGVASVPPAVIQTNVVVGAQPNSWTPTETQGISPAPQFEIIPPRPGHDFFWQDGFWSWQG